MSRDTHTHTHTHMHTQRSTYIDTYTPTHTHTHTYIYTYTQRFEFDHGLARMSCVGVNEQSGEAFVFVKGGYESVASIATHETGLVSVLLFS